MRRLLLLALVPLAFAPATAAQLRVPTIIQRVIPATRDAQHQQQADAVLSGIDALRADFRTVAGSDTVYFPGDTAGLSPPAMATLAAQAQWLRRHPAVVVQIEGHAATTDTRDHALALGARRAAEVRQFLVLNGVPAAQLSIVSYGKERPIGANARAVTVLVR